MKKLNKGEKVLLGFCELNQKSNQTPDNIDNKG